MAAQSHYPRAPVGATPGVHPGSLVPCPRPLRFLTLREVRERTTLSRSAVYRQMAAGTFPLQVTVGCRSVAWVEAEVEAWMLERIAPAEGHRRCA